MNSLLRIAVSSLVLGAALMGNSAGNANASASTAITAKADRQATKFATKADAALKARQADKAIEFAEKAVALSPRDAGHRALLGQSYLAAGRFASAAAALRDALTLSPAHGRAALGLGLAEIAQGHNEAAREALAQARGLVPDADYGLALALAGDRDASIATLEAAARGEGATAKTRQNLALAYALAARWKEAHVVAAQDVPADQLPARMAKWAQFARPRAVSDQIASLLGVTPVADPGQPTQLALVTEAPEPIAIAAVASAPEPVAVEMVAPTAESAARDEQPAPAAAPVSMAEAKERAAESIFMAAPAVPVPVMRAVDLPASKPIMQVAAVRRKAEVAAKPRPAKSGNFVVQLGAFSSPARAEAAWGKYSARSHLLGRYTPSSMRFVAPTQVAFYRLSVGGFASRAEASELCRQVKAKGGDCFVRGVAGDAPMQWVSRAKGQRFASR